MRVLIFTSLFPSPAWPTQWVYHVNLVKALAEFADVRVMAPITWHKWLRFPGKLLRESDHDRYGVPLYHPISLVVPGAPTSHGASLFRSVRPAVDKLYASWPFDAILGIWAFPDVFAAGELARRYGIPMVANVIGSDVNDLPNRPGMRPLVSRSLGSADTVIALSKALRDRVIDLGIPPERTVVQYNGVDGERFSPCDKQVMRQRVGYEGPPSLVCYVGNMLPEKGPDHLVEAFALLAGRDANGSSGLVMIGDGPMLPGLRQRVRDLGLEGRIQLPGRKPNSEIAAWLGAADVLCLPSLREGCPNVVLEALATGRPVVASDVGGLPELVSPSTGILVPAARPNELADALESALQRPWIAEHLRETVPCLSWQEFGRTFDTVIRQAVAQRRSAVARPSA